MSAGHRQYYVTPIAYQDLRYAALHVRAIQITDAPVRCSGGA